MKARFASLAAALVLSGQVLAGDYTLTIDGKAYELELGKPATIELPGGRDVSVQLERNAIVTYRADNFSFQHPGEYSPSRTDLGDGVYQTMMATPVGTLVLVQEYTTINPCSLTGLMLNELTKEEVQYGYAIEKEDVSRTLGNGEKLQGVKAVSEYQGTRYTRHVLCYEARDAGVMVVTQVEKSSPAADHTMLETFWDSFSISMR